MPYVYGTKPDLTDKITRGPMGLGVPPVDFLYRGSIDLVTARVTDLDTGVTYTWAQWRVRRRQLMAARVLKLRSMRDESSDIQNLWGTKENRFTDDWFDGYVRPQIPPNPRLDFGPDGDEPPTGPGPVQAPRVGETIWNLPGVT